MEDNRDFRRALGPWSAGALVAGTIIGTGIFLFVSNVAQLLRNPVLIMVAWSVGGVIAILGSLCLAELASTYPQTGGIYVYLRRAFGPLVAFEYAWMQFLIIRVGSYCIQVTAFAGFTAGVFDLDPVAVAKPIAITALVVLCAINIIGVKWGSGVQNVLTLIKILSLCLVVIVGVLFGLGILGTPHPVKIPPPPAATDSSLLVAFGLSLVAIMWTFGGWDQSPFVAEEVINPERNLPISVVGGLLVCAVLYVLANAAYVTVLTPAEMASSEGMTAPLVLQRALGSWAGKLLNVILMISTFGAANALILTGARIAYASGRDNEVFAWFSRTHPRTKTPVLGLVAQAILGAVVIMLIPNPFKLLLYTGLAYWAFAALIPLALIVLRKRDPDARRPFRVPFYPLPAIVFGLGALAMVTAVLRDDMTYLQQPAKWLSSPPNSFVTIILLASGALVYFSQTALRRKVSRKA